MFGLVWNLPTVIVFAVVCILLALAIWYLIKERKQGRLSCGGNCGGCNGCTACHGGSCGCGGDHNV